MLINQGLRVKSYTMNKAVKHFLIKKVTAGEGFEKSDTLSIEEPLEIRLEFGTEGKRVTQNIAVTMRTPGNDVELAAGFLFTEGIITNTSDIALIDHCFITCAENKENVIKVSLQAGVIPNLTHAERNFYTTSSCGVCGKGSIQAIRTVSAFVKTMDKLVVDSDILLEFPHRLRGHQAIFADTGGLHAAALFDPTGNLLLLMEDVGRHNALDKLIGSALLKGLLPLNRSVLLLSGRASFELVQKAAMAGIRLIAAIGAPSSLAVELAEEFNITLAGFLRDDHFNIYTSAHRIVLPVHENTH